MDMLNSLQVLAGNISPASHVKKDNEKLSSKEQEVPDNDAIKMFVGQVPRSMAEDELKTMFEEFGPVHQINVLRDKVTGVSKGCCFVTYYKRSSAVAAQNALHNIKSLPGMHHPIQMKPADTENRNERKLFVGMVCKKLNEDKIRRMFEKFGNIEECIILRDNNGISKGCAFVTFSSRQMAIIAIKSMHHSQTMEGCSLPLVVKFADTQKENEHKKVQKLQGNLWNLASVNTNFLSPQYLLGTTGYQGNITGFNLTSPVPHQLASASNPLPGNFVGGPGIKNQPSSLNQLHELSNQQQHDATSGLLSLQKIPYSLDIGSSSLSFAGHGLMTAPTLDTSAASRLQGQPIQGLSYISVQNSNLANLDMATYYLQGVPLQFIYTEGQTGLLGSNACYPSTFLSQIDLLGHTVSTSYLDGSATSDASSPNDISGLDTSIYSKNETHNKTQSELKQHEGPEGANLFIYHLPPELTDADLHQSFQPFGNIVSAKVFIDKQTNISKCFGFVSYDTPISATAAIEAMNGFQIGTKRLKVQSKRNKEASKSF